nr:UvrD-helicase domain-containing protein [Psychrobacter sp. KH172YL61]
MEASAGTGKTWTLTGIVLRLLIEARRAPEQIIATTFTRAAAAEMRQRIHDRLVEFYQLLQWVNNLSADTKNKDNLYPNILQVLPDRGDNKNNKDKPTSNDSSIESNAKTEADEFNQDIDHDHKHAQQVAREKRAQVKKSA